MDESFRTGMGRRCSDPDRRVLPLLVSGRGLGRLRRLDRVDVGVSVLGFVGNCR